MKCQINMVNQCLLNLFNNIQRQISSPPPPPSCQFIPGVLRPPSRDVNSYILQNFQTVNAYDCKHDSKHDTKH